ncbi:MAG TPA: TRAP transporter substrate-binding protein [Stellaceae bacterium]|jgi:TRAP-type C4-dicarboxylate transport system substrate-binding protein
MPAAFALRALVTSLLVAVPALARAEAVTLKFGFPAPVSSYVNTDGMTPWINDVEKASDGTLQIKLFAGPTLGTFRDIYDRTLANVAQISFGVFGTLASQFPRTQVSDLPFISDDTRTSSVALWRLYAKGLLNPEYDKVKVLALFTFPGSILNSNKSVKTLDGVVGMKLAVSSRTLGDIAVAMGGSPVTLTPTELYQGMSRGVVDGILVGWTAVKTFKLEEVTKQHLSLPLGAAPAFVFMNKTAYAALPPKAKAAIDKYSGEAFSDRLGIADENANREEAKYVASLPGQSVTKLSAEQYPLWEKRIHSVVESFEKTAPDGARLLAAYREEIKKAPTTP